MALSREERTQRKDVQTQSRVDWRERGRVRDEIPIFLALVLMKNQQKLDHLFTYNSTVIYHNHGDIKLRKLYVLHHILF